MACLTRSYSPSSLVNTYSLVPAESADTSILSSFLFRLSPALGLQHEAVDRDRTLDWLQLKEPSLSIQLSELCLSSYEKRQPREATLSIRLVSGVFLVSNLLEPSPFEPSSFIQRQAPDVYRTFYSYPNLNDPLCLFQFIYLPDKCLPLFPTSDSHLNCTWS